MNIKYKMISLLDTIRYDIPRFIKNVWRFRKGLWQFRWYDPHGLYVLNDIALTEMADKIEKNGIEVDHSRFKKVQKMRRAAELYNNFVEDNFIEQAEAELGELILHPFEFEKIPDSENYAMIDKETPEEKEHNRKIFDRSRKIEEEQWAELYTILKGQDYSTFRDDIDFDDQFDGSGLRGWWD